jgi:hypothetical protein
MTSKLPIVPPKEITPQWLTQALRINDIDASVSDIVVETVGTGQLGETRRFRLEYSGAVPANAPRSLVGKFPSDTEVARQSGRDLGFYRSEVMFYREAAHRAVIKTPKKYVAEIDDVGDFVLLLEDMAPAVPGDQMRGCTLAEARLALAEAAKLHAAFWNDQELMKQDWLYVPHGAQGFYTTELMESSWIHFEKTYHHRFEPEVMKVCEKFVKSHAAWNAPRAMPKTYSHCDYRPDNMLFGGERVVVVDWQTSNFLGSGMDVAYFLGGVFDRETRRNHEDELLHFYYDELIANGVADYSFDHLMADYRHYCFAVLAVIINATVIVKQTERGDRMFIQMINGGAHQALDNNALDILPT